MKRTISTLALAAPLATVALSLGATPAMAEPAGPATDQITSTKLGPVNPHLPEDPQEENPQNDPDPEPAPDGSDVPDDKVAIPTPCSTPSDDPDDEDEPGDEDPAPRIQDEKDAGDEDEPGEGDIPRPNCIDAGAASSDGGMELAWLMAGGGLITATSAAYAVRSRVRARA